MNTHRGINMKQTTNKKGGNGTRFLLREKRKGYICFYTPIKWCSVDIYLREPHAAQDRALHKKRHSLQKY